MLETGQGEVADGAMMDGSTVELVPQPESGEVELSEQESAEFAEDCKTIINELGAFVRVGKALQRIKSKRLYRAKYKNFEACVRDLFDLGRRRAYQFIDAAEVMDLLEAKVQNAKHVSHFENGKASESVKNFSQNEVILPKNEGQALALLAAPEEQRADIWLQTLESADGKITAKKITETIRRVNGAEIKEKIEEAEEELDKKQKKEGRKTDEKFSQAFNAFMEQITNDCLNGWQTVPKKDVVKHLRLIIDYIEKH